MSKNDNSSETDVYVRYQHGWLRIRGQYRTFENADFGSHWIMMQNIRLLSVSEEGLHGIQKPKCVIFSLMQTAEILGFI